jgi:hypothetical protein
VLALRVDEIGAVGKIILNGIARMIGSPILEYPWVMISGAPVAEAQVEAYPKPNASGE